MAETEQPAAGEWKHSKFSCFEDIPGALCACFLMPCYAYKTAEAAGESTGCSVLACCFPITLTCVRGHVREKNGIEGSFCGDCVSMAFCGCCTAVQLKRECE